MISNLTVTDHLTSHALLAIQLSQLMITLLNVMLNGWEGFIVSWDFP